MGHADARDDPGASGGRDPVTTLEATEATWLPSHPELPQRNGKGSKPRCYSPTGHLNALNSTPHRDHDRSDGVYGAPRPPFGTSVQLNSRAA